MGTKKILTENDLPPDVMHAIRQGRKIEAIKRLREATGLGFANAKVLVDKAAREHGRKAGTPGLVEERASLGKLLKALLLVVVVFYLYREFLAR